MSYLRLKLLVMKMIIPLLDNVGQMMEIVSD